MNSTIDGRGGRLDLVVRSLADMPTIQLTFTNEDGSPLDLTDAVLSARGATVEAPPVPMAMVAAVVGDPTLGVVTLDVARAEVDRMQAPSSVSSVPRVGATWTMDVTISGRTAPLLWGEVLVGAGIAP